MDTIILLEIAGVLASWAVVAFAIWKWGPGVRKRSVPCPNLNVHAEVLTDQRESEFGCLRVVDIRDCSLIPSAVVTCQKDCLAHL